MATTIKTETVASNRLGQDTLRFIIATPICDGHDVAAAAITRLLRRQGVDAIYLGFNKSVKQIVKAVVEEDASAIALSTYNGGHMSFIRELLKEQRRQGVGHIPLFCGGGGTILAREVAPLERMGVAKVYRPPLDLGDAIADMVVRTEALSSTPQPKVAPRGFGSIAKDLTNVNVDVTEAVSRPQDAESPPVVWGFNGRGGAGKSTLIDELLSRFLEKCSGLVAVLSLDPTLGDRLRMLYCYSPRVYLRSVRLGPKDNLDKELGSRIGVLREAGFDLILVESVGLGQNDLGVIPYVDAAVFCLTPDYGTDIQLEKEALLPLADIVVLNKSDYPQAIARGRRVKNMLAKEQAFFITEAKKHRDLGIDELFTEIASQSHLQTRGVKSKIAGQMLEDPIPLERRNYLSGVITTHDEYYEEMEQEIVRVKTDPSRAEVYSAKFQELWDQHGYSGKPEPGDQLEAGELYRKGEDGKWILVARETTCDIWVPVLALPPKDSSPPEIVRYLYKQNVPGGFPYTEGAYRSRRSDQDPIRMFAGLGLPETTNTRFHLLRNRGGSPRLSTAFDSLSLYGLDSDEPGALAKIGEGGVAVDTVEDMVRLYDGFDLEATSVSMTISGPAVTVLAMYLAAAKRRGFDWRKLRGTIQTDIFKEIQAQNEAVFPLEPSLRLISDMTAFTIREVPLWYPISISGYHIGEAGANPVQELAFTLANGLTYVEVLRARGLSIQEVTKRFSFFFTFGSELEFNVLGRVARRIWAVAMDRYYQIQGTGQALRFHSQTSGRALKDVDPLHNLTRVTLQAEHALHNNTNSLHTNSYKETYTTPEEDDVLLAMGSQQIPLLESGDFRFTENLNQGSYGLSYLEDEVERAVYNIFREIDQQGGVIPAIENEYHRTLIQEEVQKEYRAQTDGRRVVIGVNYLKAPDGDQPRGSLVNIPSSDKRKQVRRTKEFKARNARQASVALERLKQAAIGENNVFEVLLDAVEVASLGQITHALWDVWGRFRPSM